MTTRSFRAIVGCLLLAAGFAVAPSLLRGQNQTIDLVVSHPPDFTLLEKYELPVEGYVRTAGVDEIEIVVNDDRPLRVYVRDRLFAEEVSLEAGLNTVRIGPLERRVWVATAAAKPPAEFRPVYGHFGLSDGCLECHETDESGTFPLAGEPREICLWCHGDLTRGRRSDPWVSVHAPVRDGKCLGCHAPHTSRSRGLPADNPPECPDCHAAVTDRLETDRFVHGPMNLGDCRLCHTVHASAEPKLLVRPATSLCTDCHSDALPPAGTPAALQPHPMIPEGQCGRCHEPHSSANPRMLRQPAGRLCQECHAGKTRSFHEAKGFSIYVCAKCHDLHRPTQPHLIMDASRSLCTQCHDFSADAVFTHSFVEAGKCFLCHTFHEAPLSADVASLCLGCHRDNPRLPQAHRGVPFERSHCTSCHRPHQARRDKLLRVEEHTPFRERACERCHRERAAKVGPLFAPLCIDCHRDRDIATAAAGVVFHPPFRDDDCSGCHRSHNSETPGLLREPEGPLCLGCHRRMRKATLITPVSSHPGVIEGRCGSCHDPHFSTEPSLLRQAQGELCRSCHAALVRSPGGEPWAVEHIPVAEGKCRLCHRSHTAIVGKLLKSPPPQPCRPCHPGFFAATEGGGVVSLHEPVKEGECAVCHDLHGAALPELLKEGARGPVCRGCHADPEGEHHRFSAEQYQAKGLGVRAQADGCLLCHVPHVSAQRRLLLASGEGVCKSCHKL